MERQVFQKRHASSAKTHPVSSPVASTLVDTMHWMARSRDAEAQSMLDTARAALQKCRLSPVLLAEFIEARQTPVYIMRTGLLARLVLLILGIAPGFVPPSAGWRYRLLGRFLKTQASRPGQAGIIAEGAGLDSMEGEPGMFVLTPALFSMGFMAYQFHYWLSFKAGMAGYTAQAQSLYQKFWERDNGTLDEQAVAVMGEQDLRELKAAINRDLEALCFFRDIVQDVLLFANEQPQFAKPIAVNSASPKILKDEARQSA